MVKQFYIYKKKSLNCYRLWIVLVYLRSSSWAIYRGLISILFIFGSDQLSTLRLTPKKASFSFRTS
jgi:hypothetical protein